MPDGYPVEASELDRWMDGPVSPTRRSRNVLTAFGILAKVERDALARAGAETQAMSSPEGV